ncbi:MAG TPA: RtcB family protein [Candidatus Omnitrophica bacterium]|nr:RtcB family protein [Candidatus Omnitrophota bacterium]
MRVPGIIYSDERMIEHIQREQVIKQVANVACLPGIMRYSLAMPDAHWGYGFAIGGVAATDPQEGGVISPGGVGYDINCGVRLVKTNLDVQDIRNRIAQLMDALFVNVPCGVGIGGRIKLSPSQERELLVKGSKWAVEQGYGTEDDLAHTEENGYLKGADPDKVGDRAYERGKGQSGTLGSGNHFLEIQVVDEIYDELKAKVFGLKKGQVVVMIHSGSRGLGHQICDDNLRIMQKAVSKYGITLPDRQLVSAPVESKEGRDYFSAMACAANYAWGNRQILMHLVRETFEKIFSRDWQSLGMKLIYDVAHNIAKFEKHKVDGKERLLCVHRKGATRAFPPNHPHIPEEYRTIGQPVIIPGDMGRVSYLLVGTQRAFDETWGSTCHGAGRMMSRHQAIKSARGRSIYKEMESKGIMVRARGKTTLAEEMSEAYKDVNIVVDIVQNAGISERVARMRPLGVVKG